MPSRCSKESPAARPPPTLLDLLGDAYTQTKDLPKAEAAYRKAVELDPAELSHRTGLGQTLLAEEKYAEALTVYQKLSDLMPDDSDVYLRLAQIYRELHQLDKAEENLLKARQYAPGSLDVMYNEAMLYEAQGRFEDAIRVLSDAVTGVKGQSRAAVAAALARHPVPATGPAVSRHAELFGRGIHLRRAGPPWRRRRSPCAAADHGHVPRGEGFAEGACRQARKRWRNIRTILAFVRPTPCLLGENGQTDEAVKMLRSQLTKSEADREIYLNIAQVYERGRRYKEAEEAAHAAEAIPGQPRDNEMVWFLLGAIYERQKFFDKAEVEFKKALDVNPKTLRCSITTAICSATWASGLTKRNLSSNAR